MRTGQYVTNIHIAFTTHKVVYTYKKRGQLSIPSNQMNEFNQLAHWFNKFLNKSLMAVPIWILIFLTHIAWLSPADTMLDFVPSLKTTQTN